jgi:(p)ppGpp synthase/HD superfamily hydrolase
MYLGDHFTRAVDYARHLHIERRKGTGIPYLAHLVGVASLVMGEAGHAPVPVTEDMVIAALLHDAAEDHGGLMRLRDIEHNFGPNVARMVEGLTDSFAEDRNEKIAWEERKNAYLQRLQCEPDDVHLISAANKLYNARAILADSEDVSMAAGFLLSAQVARCQHQGFQYESAYDVLRSRERRTPEMIRIRSSNAPIHA